GSRSRHVAERTRGPPRSASPHTQRFGAGAAVAGISNPLLDVRSPLSGFSTTIRSPVRRRSSVLPEGVRCLRGFEARAFGDLAASGMAAIVARTTRREAERRCGYHPRPMKASRKAKDVLSDAVATL